MNATDYAYALKRYYPQWRMLQMVAEDNPGYAMASKKTDGSSGPYVFGVKYSTPSRASTFALAQSNTGSGKGKKFLLTFGDDYGVVRITEKLLAGSKGDAKSLMDAATSQTDDIMLAMNNSLGRQFFGNGSGEIAQISAAAALGTTTLLLANPEDIVHFHEEQQLVFAANDTSALRTTTAIEVTARDEDDGALTLAVTPNSLAAGIAVGDAIFTEGDYVSASDRLQMVGLAGWIPVTKPTAGDSFFGVDRSDDPTRLAGQRFTDATTYAGYSTTDAIQLIASRLGRNNWKPDTCFMSFERFRLVVQALGAKEEYTRTVPISVQGPSGKMVQCAEVGFSAIKVHGPKGKIEVIPDRNCPEDTIFVGQMKYIECIGIGDCPHWISSADGDRMRTVDNAASQEARIVSWPQMGVRAPAAWGRFDWL